MIERCSTRWRPWSHSLSRERRGASPGKGGPLRGSSAHGRWSPNGEFEVLYTSLKRDGALAEIGYRLSLEPIWPSRIQHDLHKIGIRTEKTLQFADVAALQSLGVNPAKYPGFDYTATQAITSAAHFLGLDGLLVPSARTPCTKSSASSNGLPKPDTLRYSERLRGLDRLEKEQEMTRCPPSHSLITEKNYDCCAP